MHVKLHKKIKIMKYLKEIGGILLLLTIVSCSVFSSKTKDYLEVKDAKVLPWVLKDGERKGETVEVNLTGEIREVKVLALIYSKEQLKPMVEVKDNILHVYADFEKGMNKLFPTPAITEKEDMIIYSYKGHIYNLRLEHVERSPIKYYTNK